MRHWATSCRPWQLPILLASMQRHCQPFTLHVLAWDWEPRGERPGVVFTTRAELLRLYPALGRLPGRPRSPTDEACSVRWTWYAHLVDRLGEVICIDGDMMFWSDPEPALTEVDATAGMVVSPHDFPLAAQVTAGVTRETHRRYGLFNGGLVLQRDQAAAWAMGESCREWCYGEVRQVDGWPWYGDQGALEDVAHRFNADAFRHPGLNLAPWNIHGRKITRAHDGTVFVNGRPLVLYHYSSLRRAPDGTISQLWDASYALSEEHREVLYEPYLSELRRILG